MYIDAVFDENNFVVFQGNRQETEEWLKTHVTYEGMRVLIGEDTKYVSVATYLDK